MLSQRILICLFPLITTCLAGVGVLSPEDEEQVLHLFHKVCSHHNHHEGGAELGGFRVFCKSAHEDFQETVSHQVQIPPAPPLPAQVVFVQPPAVRYLHNILLTGSQGQPQQSKIYVLPQKATHQIAAQFNPGQIASTKPVVYFLNRHVSSGGGQHQHLQPEQPQQHPHPQYGLPHPHPVQEQQHPHPQYALPQPHPVQEQQQFIPVHPEHQEQQYGPPLLALSPIPQQPQQPHPDFGVVLEQPVPVSHPHPQIPQQQQHQDAFIGPQPVHVSHPHPQIPQQQQLQDAFIVQHPSQQSGGYA